MSVLCLFPKFLPFPEELVPFRLPGLMWHFPEVTIYSPSSVVIDPVVFRNSSFWPG